MDMSYPLARLHVWNFLFDSKAEVGSLHKAVLFVLTSVVADVVVGCTPSIR